MKYSEAKHLKIVLHYTPEFLKITATDDGKGFDMDTVKEGSGLLNMKSRAALINAKLDVLSKPNEGVQLEFIYPFS